MTSYMIFTVNNIYSYLENNKDIQNLTFSEWHPFTISSAPEQPGSFTLHIRGVGQWTNRLYSYFEEVHRRQVLGMDEKASSNIVR